METLSTLLMENLWQQLLNKVFVKLVFQYTFFFLIVKKHNFVSTFPNKR